MPPTKPSTTKRRPGGSVVLRLFAGLTLGLFQVGLCPGPGWLSGASGLAGSASAQGLQDGAAVELNDGSPKEVENVTVVQNLGAKIPSNLPLQDWLGRKVKTARYFDGEKPTIVTLNYSDCPVLCSVQLNQLTESLRALDLELGKDFRILTVSINPKETTERIRETREKYVDQLEGDERGEEGWAFCTAPQATINQLAQTLGFKYTFDKLTGQYYHPAMLAFVSPEGVITRYSLDVSFPPDQMRLAILESGEGKVGSPVDLFILRCFSYDPDRNSYVLGAWRLMRFGGAATVGVMLAALVPYWIGRKRAPRALGEAETDSGVEK